MARPIVPPGGSCTIYSDVRISPNEQISFASKESQAAYFAKHVVATFPEVSYVRDQNVVRLELTSPNMFSNIEKVNYMSYVNSGFSGRTYYGMLSRPRYVNNVTVEFDFNYDGFQTFMGEFEIEPSVVLSEELSEADYAKATADPHTNDILELTTEEGFNIKDSSYEILDELSPTGEIHTNGPIPGTYTYMPSKLSGNTSHMETIALFKISMNMNKEEYQEAPISTEGSGKVFRAVETYSNLAILNMFSGFIVPGYEYAGGEILNSNIIVAMTDWAAKLAASSGMSSKYWLDSVAAELTELTKKKISASDIANITDLDYIMEQFYDTFDVKYANGALVNTSNRFDNREITEVLAWFEYDENGELPDTFKRALDSLAANDLISSITFAGRVPKFFVEFTPIHGQDDKVVGYRNISYPETSKPNYPYFAMNIDKPKGALHPKLYRYPFNFLRLEMPDRTIADYKYENFTSQDVNFSLYGDVHGIPTMSIIPAWYNRKPFLSGKYTDYLNTDEAMSFNKFPQLNISTDAYLTQMSSEWQNQAGRSTMEKLGEIGSNIIALTSAAQSIGSAIATGGASLSAPGQIGAITGSVGTLGNSFVNAAKRSDARDILAGDTDKAYTSWFYDGAADVNKKANQSQTSTIVNLSQAFDYTRCKVEAMVLKEPIIGALNKSLIRYGCKSGRVGVPRVANYMLGSTTATDIPHFQSLDDTTEVGTPVRTENAHATGVDSDTKQQIESIFNNGCWFWKGESL